MIWKLLLASVAAIGLLLTGPQKASAQVVYACVTSIGNIAIVAANVNCPAGGTKITLSQTPGAIAARQYNCSPEPQTVANFAAVTLVDSGVSFGTTLPTPVGSFSSFLLQPGFYQAHLFTDPVEVAHGPIMSFGNFSPSAAWSIGGTSKLSGDRFFSVTTANTSAALVYSGGGTVDLSLQPQCLFNLTQLH